MFIMFCFSIEYNETLRKCFRKFRTQTKDEPKSLRFSLSKDTCTAVIMLYKITKAIVYSFGGDTDLFDFIVGVLQEDILLLFLVFICQDYVRQTSIDLMEKSFHIKKGKRFTVSCTNFSNAGYVNDQELLEDSPAQTLHLLHGLEQAVGA